MKEKQMATNPLGEEEKINSILEINNEKPNDRIALIDERIEILKRDIKIKYLEYELKTLKDHKSVPLDLREREAKELMVF